MSDKSLDKFAAELQSFLADLDWTKLALAAIVLLMFTFARRPLANTSLSLVKAILVHLGIGLSDKLRGAIQAATELLIVGIGLLIFANLLRFTGQMGDIVERVAYSVLVSAVFCAAYGTSGLAASILVGSSDGTRNVSAGWVEKALQVLAACLGIASVLRVWGIDIAPLLTGVGIAGAATALAAQDVIKNLFGGMSNMAERRFEVGDWVRADGVVEGVVEDISLRSTAIRQFDLSLVHVPNGDLANAPLINVSQMRHRRINMRVKLHCDTSVQQLSAITQQTAKFVSSSKLFAQPPDVSQYIHVVSLDDKSVDLMVYCFTKSKIYADYLAAREALVFEIKSAVSKVNARFAFESHKFIIENASDFRL